MKDHYLDSLKLKSSRFLTSVMKNPTKYNPATAQGSRVASKIATTPLNTPPVIPSLANHYLSIMKES